MPVLFPFNSHWKAGEFPAEEATALKVVANPEQTVVLFVETTTEGVTVCTTISVKRSLYKVPFTRQRYCCPLQPYGIELICNIPVCVPE